MVWPRELSPQATTWVWAGDDFCAALRSDGSIVAWGILGSNLFGELNVPPLPPGLTYNQIAAGGYHAGALRSDGWIVAWGDNCYGQTNVQALPPGLVYTQVTAGGGWDPYTYLTWGVQCAHGQTVALRSDGSAAAWGGGIFSGPATVPPGSYIQAASGAAFTVFLTTTAPAQAPMGTGCAGSNGVTTLSSAQLPWLGNFAFTVDVTQGAVNSQAWLFLAVSPASPPTSLGGGCTLYLDATSLQAWGAAGVSPLGPLPTGFLGATSFNLPVPADPVSCTIETPRALSEAGLCIWARGIRSVLPQIASLGSFDGPGGT